MKEGCEMEAAGGQAASNWAALEALREPSCRTGEVGQTSGLRRRAGCLDGRAQGVSCGLCRWQPHF